MFDFSGYSSEELIETEAPLTQELITKFFEAREQQSKLGFILDYQKCTLRGKTLLTYISNLDIDCDIKITRETPKEDRMKLMLDYMEFQNLVECPSLAAQAAILLTMAKDMRALIDAAQNPILDFEESKEFILANKSIIGNWVVMMDSMVVFTMSNSRRYVESFGPVDEQFPVVDNATIVGKNFVNLLYLGEFMSNFYEDPGQNLYYFKKQFEEPMFKSQHLMYHFWRETNPLPGILELMGDEDYDIMEAEVELNAIKKAIGEQ